MKPQTLNLWLKGNLAIKILIILFFIACKSTSYGQEGVDYYYQIINKIIDDKIYLSEKRENLYKEYISSGKFTEDEIRAYKNRILEDSNNLYYKESNSFLLENLKKGILEDFFTKKELSQMVKLLNNEREFDQNQVASKVNLVNEGYIHSFSSPVIIDDKLIFSHTFIISKYSSHSKLFIYTKDKSQKFKLEKVLEL